MKSEKSQKKYGILSGAKSRTEFTKSGTASLHHCITITGFSFVPVVSLILRKMLFVGVC
jgi:hypothetical protein